MLATLPRLHTPKSKLGPPVWGLGKTLKSSSCTNDTAEQQLCPPPPPPQKKKDAGIIRGKELANEARTRIYLTRALDREDWAIVVRRAKAITGL